MVLIATAASFAVLALLAVLPLVALLAFADHRSGRARRHDTVP